MKSENVKPSFKRPKQLRSKMTFDAIIQAGMIILNKDGIKKFNTNHIAKVAGVSIASLYQYFPNKESIFMALIEEFYQRKFKLIEDVITTQMAQKTEYSTILDLTVHAFIQYELDMPKVNHLIQKYSNQLGLDSVIEDAEKDFIQTTSSIVSTNNANISFEKISKKLRLLTYLMKGVHKALYDASTNTGGNLEEVKSETIQMIKSYMQKEDIYQSH
jgi:AcrR family transcriptional regulator